MTRGIGGDDAADACPVSCRLKAGELRLRKLGGSLAIEVLLLTGYVFYDR